MTGKKNLGGRPTKASDKTIKILLDGIKAGLSYEGACGLARISHTTFSSWRKRGEAGESERFVKFVEELEYAESIAEAEQLRKIKADPDTKFACWILERRYPDRWGKSQRVELSGNSCRPPIQILEIRHPPDPDND